MFLFILRQKRTSVFLCYIHTKSIKPTESRSRRNRGRFLHFLPLLFSLDDFWNILIFLYLANIACCCATGHCGIKHKIRTPSWQRRVITLLWLELGFDHWSESWLTQPEGLLRFHVGCTAYTFWDSEGTWALLEWPDTSVSRLSPDFRVLWGKLVNNVIAAFSCALSEGHLPWVLSPWIHWVWGRVFFHWTADKEKNQYVKAVVSFWVDSQWTGLVTCSVDSEAAHLSSSFSLSAAPDLPVTWRTVQSPTYLVKEKQNLSAHTSARSTTVFCLQCGSHWWVA